VNRSLAKAEVSLRSAEDTHAQVVEGDRRVSCAEVVSGDGAPETNALLASATGDDAMNGQPIPSTTKLTFYLVLALTWIQISAAPARAQTAFVAGESTLARPRITEPIDDSVVVTIPGSRPRVLDRATDLGRMDGDTKMGPMFLILKPSPEQERALQTLLGQQQDKGSPDYHRWLTPDEFGGAFGVDEADLQKVADWLTNRGFTVQRVARGRRSVSFTGRAENVEEAFRIEMHRYLVGGAGHFSNNTDVRVPAAFGGVAAGLMGLDDFTTRPGSRIKIQDERRPSTTGQQPPEPEYTGLTGHYLSPGDFAVIYNTYPLIQQGYDGTGVKIGVVGQSDINLSDVSNFRKMFLPTNYWNVLPQVTAAGDDPGITGGGNEVEADLDVEWAGAVAPGAQITLVASKDGPLFRPQVQYLVDSDSVDIISMSMGVCEETWETYEKSWGTYLEDLWEQAAAQGITVFVSAGDSGSAGCDDHNSSSPSQYGYAVNGFASTPYTVAVGGTEFYENGNDGDYWTCYTEPVGCPSNPFTLMPYTSALGYIPEAVWNESGANGGTGILGGGGGVSTLHAQPSWQTGPDVPSTDPISVPSSVAGPHRYLPDVSLTAANHDGYLMCTEAQSWVDTLFNPQTLGGNCWTGGPASAAVEGGTSASTPAFAGIQALINQKFGRQGQANYVYYRLAALQDTSACNSFRGPNSSCIFNDITYGSNGVPCVPGSATTCTIMATTGGPIYALQDFNAGTGYDLATGLGSVNAQNLFQQWDTAVFRSTTTTLQTTTPASGFANYGQPVTLTASVYVPSNQASSQQWGPPIAGWIVAFSDATNSTQLGTATLTYSASGSDFVATFSTSSLSVGVHSITATFPGNLSSMYYGTSTSLPVTVTVQQQSTLPTLTGLTVSPSTLTLGGSASVTATLSAAAPSSGAQINLTSSNSTAFPAPGTLIIPAGQTSGSSSPVVAGSVATSTTLVLNASYNGSSQQATVVVNPSASIGLTIALNASQTTINAGQSITLTANFGGATNGAPTGLAHFYDYFNGVATNVGNTSIGLSGGMYSAVLTTGSLLAGQHAFTVIYNGDSNYSSAISNVANVTAQQQSQGSLVLSNFTITPASIVGGYPSQGNVFLTGNAPAGGATVTLTSNNTHFVQVPPTVTVTPGYSNVAFPITTSFTGGTVGATITASYNNTTYLASLTVLPVAVTAVTFSPSSVPAGYSVSVTAWLSGPAPAGGASVTLVSSNPSALQVPASLIIPAGAISAATTAAALSVPSQESIGVTAGYNSSSVTQGVTVTPLTLTSFGLSPLDVTGGNPISGSVWLSNAAPPGGANVTVSSSSSLVQISSPVTVPAGMSSTTFTATTSPVNVITNVTITANYGGASENLTVTLVPPLPNLATFTVNPSTVVGGTTSTATVTLTAPAPLGGIAFNIASSFWAVAQLPGNGGISIPEGSSSGTLTINTAVVNYITPVTIAATYNGITLTALLTIVPAGTPTAPSSLTLSPLTVTGGGSSNGTVLLTGPAPATGAIVSLSSDNEAVQVPPVTGISPGLRSGVFTVSTASVFSISTATITATYNGISQSCLLTVEPSGPLPPVNPLPFLSTPLVPISVVPGGVGFSLTVDGTQFVPGAQILWNGTALPTNFISSGQLQTTVPAPTVQANGSAIIAVQNPGTANLMSNTLTEHITYPRPVPSFSTTSFPVSNTTWAIAAGDFNRDGKLDLAVGGSEAGGLSIFLGNGDGTFGPEMRLPVNNSSALAVGDFNGDGKLDIVYDNSSLTSGSIGILLGNGDGTFTPMPSIPLPAAPGQWSALAAADLNGDGFLDIVITGSNLTQAYVLLGKGDGTFANPSSVGVVGSPYTLAVADFNGDGKLDIALADSQNQKVSILLGNGDGTFQPQQEYSTPGYAIQICAADFNGDGYPDLAIGNSGLGGGISILLNNGDGTFRAGTTIAPGTNYYFVATDDINGDGKLDLVVFRESSGGGNEVFLGNGDGTFSSTPFELGTSLEAPATIADLNGDGAPDILVPNYQGSVTVLLQNLPPILQATPANLTFTLTQGAGNSSPVSLTISNSGGGTEVWSASATQPWLGLSQTSGTAPSTINVNANPTGLNPGTYNDTITITATGASNSPVMVPVTFVVNPAPLVVESLSLNPTILTGPGTATGTVTLSSSAPTGGATVSLSSSSAVVQVPSTMEVTAGLASGTFNTSASAVTAQTSGTITAHYNGVSTTATLTVNPAPAIASLSPSSATAGAAAFALTVTGTNFVNGSTVQWNGSGRSTTFVSATQLTAAILASDIATG